MTLLKVFTLLTSFTNPLFVAVDLLNKLHELELMTKITILLLSMLMENFPSVEILPAGLNICESVPFSVSFPR